LIRLMIQDVEARDEPGHDESSMRALV
jgi:hypothetical protein